MTDAFDKLFVHDWVEMAGAIADVLYPYVRLQSRHNPERVWLPVDKSLTVPQQIYIAMLLRIVDYVIGTRQTHFITPAELEEETGLPGGSIRPALLRLEHTRYVTRNGYGQYEVRFPHIVPIDKVVPGGIEVNR